MGGEDLEGVQREATLTQEASAPGTSYRIKCGDKGEDQALRSVGARDRETSSPGPYAGPGW